MGRAVLGSLSSIRTHLNAKVGSPQHTHDAQPPLFFLERKRQEVSQSLSGLGVSLGGGGDTQLPGLRWSREADCAM